MPTPVEVLIVAAAYGGVVAVGVVWMEWLRENAASNKLQGGLFALWLFLGCGAATRTARIGTKPPPQQESPRACKNSKPPWPTCRAKT